MALAAGIFPAARGIDRKAGPAQAAARSGQRAVMRAHDV